MSHSRSPRRLRIAFVMPGIGVVHRGAEAFVVEMADALAHRPGLDITLFSRAVPTVPTGTVAHQRIRALPRDTAWVRRLYAATRFGRKVLDTLFLDPLNLEWYTAALSAFPTLWKERYDVVVMEGGLVGAWLARLLRRFRGTAFVDVAHGLDPKWEGAFARQRPDRVVTFTSAAQTIIANQAPEARIEVIPHGIDLERFQPAQDSAESGLPAPVVMTAGAVDGHKRLHLALDAVAELARRGRTASFLVLGDGPEAALLDQRAQQQLPAGRYRRLTVPRGEMARWYAAADVFTLPSRTESFGLAYLEAMACGLPCVAPDDAVRREVLGDGSGGERHGDRGDPGKPGKPGKPGDRGGPGGPGGPGGLLADPQDTAAYADALAAALDQDWGKAPRRRAECFPVTATVDAWERLLREVAS